MKRRNMVAWRDEVIRVYGDRCAARAISYCDGPVECHHIWLRSQGGEDDWRNGLPLCKRHHMAVHARELRIRKAWLHHEAELYLAEKGVVGWDHLGVFGRHMRGFE